MSREQWEQALARALVEGSFRARLLSDPADTLADYGLGDDQRWIVESMRTSSLADLTCAFLRVNKRHWETRCDELVALGEVH